MSGETEAVARPYARALLSATGADRGLVQECLAAVTLALRDARVAALVTDPRVDAAALAQAFALPDAPCESVRRLVRLLIENRRLTLLPEIARAFTELKDEVENRVQATITSAQPLAPEEIERLRAALARRTGCDVVVRAEVDPALLAGVIVQHGDKVFDGSVRGRLAALAQRLRLPS